MKRFQVFLVGRDELQNEPNSSVRYCVLSTTPDITAMSVKASQNQAGQTISDD